MEILVFKTNLSDVNHIANVMPSLDDHPGIKEWNVDLQDCDKVLRIIAERTPARDIEKLVFNAGYICEELK